MKPYLKIGLPVTLVGALLTWFAMNVGAACTPLGTTTTTLVLCKPAQGETGWAAVINANYDTIDALFSGASILRTSKGGTGLATSGTDTTKALMSDGAGGFVMAAPSGGAVFGTGAGQPIAIGQTAYTGPAMSVNTTELWTSTEGTVSTPIPAAVTFSKFYVRIFVAGSTASNLTFTVRKNGVDTTITKAVVNNAAAPATYSDTAHTATFAAGDLLSVKIVNADGANASATIAGWMLQ